MSENTNSGKAFLILAILMLLGGLVFGLLASFVYIDSQFLKDTLGFVALRPMHVSLVVFWIIIGASGSVLTALQDIKPKSLNPKLLYIHILCWLVAIIGVISSYLKHDFGGREYWEFNPVWALPIAFSWILYLIQFFAVAKTIEKWPVYIWMWMTGGVFFLFIFSENYLWLFPYFREHFITDMTIQWKVNGSLVGAWNQLIYGVSFFLMDKISGNKNVGQNKTAFFMYFLGLFNLMFNWGHHVYTLPTANYVRYIGYAVSMTEWILFIRIIINWKKDLTTAQKHFHYFPYRFLLASEIWVFLNLTAALFMSIPAFNIYTHGTHFTVAHSMGTTIGINTMILLAACFVFFSNACHSYNKSTKILNTTFWILQFSLFTFWLSLKLAGIKKGIWQNSSTQSNYHQLMQSLEPYFIVFVIAGVILLITLSIFGVTILYNHYACKIKTSSSIQTSNSTTI
ncbi:MAG: cbb3-type cytochrome c oxidase subunit I [Bacteroidia bacterium]|nr:cbb3-type cytochrome c oxidase subunit I [Bacteroidia bacterium]MCZ2139996.1 cbb3-type cytochrome c oxidase subunit I [Bacteroidia bacterium]